MTVFVDALSNNVRKSVWQLWRYRDPNTDARWFTNRNCNIESENPPQTKHWLQSILRWFLNQPMVQPPESCSSIRWLSPLRPQLLLNHSRNIAYYQWQRWERVAIPSLNCFVMQFARWRISCWSERKVNRWHSRLYVHYMSLPCHLVGWVPLPPILYIQRLPQRSSDSAVTGPVGIHYDSVTRVGLHAEAWRWPIRSDHVHDQARNHQYDSNRPSVRHLSLAPLTL
jgi:hypothetical protein